MDDTMNTETFLKQATGNDRHTFYAVATYPKAKIPTITRKNSKWGVVEKYLYNNNRDIFFKADINRAIRIDLDFNDSSRIDAVQAILTERCIQPNFYMNTTNGYHLFWIFETEIRSELLFDATSKLNNLIGGDIKAVASPSWRVPNTYSHSSGFPVFCKLINTQIPSHDFNSLTRSIGSMNADDWLDAVFGQNDDLGIVSSTQLCNYPTDQGKPSKNQQSHQEPVGRSERYKEIGKVLEAARGDRRLLESYLGLSGDSFCCPLHNDTKPSAGIFVNPKTAHCWFKCFGCKAMGDIFEVVKLKEGITRGKSVIRILELAGRRDLIEFDTEYCTVDTSYLDSNLLSLTKLCNYPTKGWITNFLIKFTALAKNKIKNADLKFPASTGEIKKLIGGGSSAVNKLYLLRLCGLLEIAQIPEVLKPLQESFKARKGVKNDTSWHKIPVWTPELIESAIKILNKASEFEINTKRCTKAQIKAAFPEVPLSQVYHGESTVWRGYTSTYEELLEEQDLRSEMTDEELEREFLTNMGIECVLPEPLGTNYEVIDTGIVKCENMDA